MYTSEGMLSIPGDLLFLSEAIAVDISSRVKSLVFIGKVCFGVPILGIGGMLALLRSLKYILKFNLSLLSLAVH